MTAESNPNAVTQTTGQEQFAEASDTPIADGILTYWNGELLNPPAERVTVIVGECPPGWWCSDHVGEERPAVRFEYRGETSYIDDKGGHGWAKVTTGKGSPRYESRSIPVAREVAA